VSLAYGNFAQYCIAASSDCGACTFTRAPGGITNNQFVCVRQNAPLNSPGIAEANLIVGGGYAKFVVTTGALFTPCTLDVDGNNAVDALTDGLIILRAMFALTGTAVTNNALGSGATRSTWPQVQAYLNGNCGTNFAL
jgi:hypothetical protein